jgi:hypothetical protein
MEDDTMTREEHAARINESLRKGLDNIIETGMRIIDARKELKHGQYIAMLENDLHIKRTAAFKLVAIASNKILADVSHAKHLPSSSETLYLLTVVANQGVDLEAAMDSDAIHPKMERKDVKGLLQNDDPEESDDDDRDDDDDRGALDGEVLTPMHSGLTALTEAWECATQEQRTSFLCGLGRATLELALAAIDAEDERTSMQRAVDRAEARSAIHRAPVADMVPEVEPKRRGGRPPGSKNKPKTIDETTVVVAPPDADDCSDTLAARMRRGESTGAPEDPYEIPPMLDRTGGAP